MIVHSLSGQQWTVRCARWSHPEMPRGLRLRSFPAQVPGCVHDALIKARVIEDTDVQNGEAAQTWVGETDWEWRTMFNVPLSLFNDHRIDLVFESIDTIAEVWVNGVVVGEAANQFHRHRFSVRSLLRESANELKVVIRSPVAWVKSQEVALGARPVNGGWTPYPFIRKSACSFGWDWGPRAPSLGLGAVSLEAWSGARIEWVRPLVVRCTESEAAIDVHIGIERTIGLPEPTSPRVEGQDFPSVSPPDSPPEHPPTVPASGLGAVIVRGHSSVPEPITCVADVELTAPDGRQWSALATFGSEDGMARLVVQNPARWWPRGVGAAQLHDLRIRLRSGEVGAVGQQDSQCVQLGAWRRRIGLRSVDLDTSADAHGERFALKVNGQDVFCMGANWIPASLHPVNAGAERCNKLLELACEANINMLRVWGGGIYESEHFYERCDELGLMVWQDFMFACATYPEDDPYPQYVEREARYNVTRLSPHPCVVLWCGGNEDILAWQSWGFREHLAPSQSWGERYWLELLPSICEQLDPTRPYWPESPWSGSLQVHANDPTRGDRHTWDLKVEEYRTIVPRFTSEFGHQSPSNLCTLREALGDDALVIGGAALANRQRAGGGDAVQYDQPLAQHFAPCVNFEEWLYCAQLLQARAMQYAITWLRANRPRSMGCLFWQWNDVWTGHSWSAVDVKLRPKPFWHALARVAAPRIVSVEPIGAGGVINGGRGGDLRVAVVNDTGEPWQTWVTIKRLGLDGVELASARDRVLVAPWSVDTSIHIDKVVEASANPRDECLMVESGDQRAWWMYERDVNLESKPARVTVGLTGSGREWCVRIHAHTLVRDLWVEPQEAWIRCAPNLLALLPGEEATVHVELEAPSEGEPALRMHAAGGLVRLVDVQSQV